MKFCDPQIGGALRNQDRKLYKKALLEDWIPVEPVVKQYPAGFKGEAQIHTISIKTSSCKNYSSITR